MRANSSRLVLVLCLAERFAFGIRAQDVPVVDNLWRLVAQEDTDGDRRITVQDRLTPFVVEDLRGRPARTISDAYRLSGLLQEFKQAGDNHRTSIALRDLDLEENIVERTHRVVNEFYWEALTRPERLILVSSPT
jgi:alpha,alpha-trehalase